MSVCTNWSLFGTITTLHCDFAALYIYVSVCTKRRRVSIFLKIINLAKPLLGNFVIFELITKPLYGILNHIKGHMYAYRHAHNGFVQH